MRMPTAQVTLVIGLLGLSACDKPTDAPMPDMAPAPVAVVEKQPNPEGIETLRREIQRREQTIGDLEAAVVMERTKLLDNPDYDPSFLNECLQEQEQNREKIEKLQQRIEQLANPQD